MKLNINQSKIITIMQKNVFRFVLLSSTVLIIMQPINTSYGKGNTVIVGNSKKESSKKKENEYLSLKELKNRISKLQKKYKNIPKNDIKVLVVGANLDYIKDNDLVEILGVDNKSDLKKWGNKLEKALNKKIDAAYETQRQYLDIYPEKPKYEHSEFIKLDELFFDEDVIKHTSFIEELINECVYNFDDLDKSRPARITLLSHIFDFKSRNYGKYIEGFIFEFDDPMLGESANYIISTYMAEATRKLNVSKTLGYLPHETPFDTLEELLEYYNNRMENKNPLEKKVSKVKILSK